jgi:Flp pilus assembly protein TadB
MSGRPPVAFLIIAVCVFLVSTFVVVRDAVTGRPGVLIVYCVALAGAFLVPALARRWRQTRRRTPS